MFFWEFALDICNGKVVLLLRMLFLKEWTFELPLFNKQSQTEYFKFWIILN